MKLARAITLGLIVWTMVLGSATTARAQSTEGKSDISLFIGHMLPNQIEGVTEILPVFGGRYSMTTRLGGVEFSGANVHAYGVDFTTVGMSLRGEIPVAEGMTGLVYGGVDFSYYRPENQLSRLTETGLHIGAGGLLLVSDSLWLRSDLKLMGGPGTSLYLLFGIAFRDPTAGN